MHILAKKIQETVVRPNLHHYPPRIEACSSTKEDAYSYCHVSRPRERGLLLQCSLKIRRIHIQPSQDWKIHACWEYLAMGNKSNMGHIAR